MTKTNEERIDELQADAVSSIETLAGRLKTELANVSRLQKDLDEARVLNGELAKTNDSLESDLRETRKLYERMSGVRAIPVTCTVRAIPVTCTLSNGKPNPKDIVGYLSLNKETEQQMALSMVNGHRIELHAIVNAGEGKLFSVAFAAVPVPAKSDPKVPVELTVKFEKTTTELRDMVLDELRKQNRSISDGVDRVKLNVWSLVEIVEEAMREQLGRMHRKQTLDAEGAYNALKNVLETIKEKSQDSMARIKPVEGSLLDYLRRLQQDREATPRDNHLYHVMTGAIEAYGELADRAAREGWVRTK